MAGGKWSPAITGVAGWRCDADDLDIGGPQGDLDDRQVDARQLRQSIAHGLGGLREARCLADFVQTLGDRRPDLGLEYNLRL